MDAPPRGPATGPRPSVHCASTRSALAATHNSMNAAADGFQDPSQEVGIEAQLDQGVRGLLVDAYLGVVRTAGSQPIVYTDVSDKRLGTLANAVGDEEVQHALRLREEAGRPPCGRPPRRLPVPLLLRARRGPVQRHRRGAASLPRGEQRRGPGDDHPGRALDAEQLVPCSRTAAWSPTSHRLDPSVPLPTLEEMVESGHRLVIGLENGDLLRSSRTSTTAGWSRKCRTTTRRWRSRGPALLPSSSRPGRRSPVPAEPLGDSPVAELAAEANAEDVLLGRARRCAEERGQPVNLVAVDFAGSGDLLPTVDALNGQAGDEPSS